MTENFERALPSLLRWDPNPIYDPVPEWWLRDADKSIVSEILAIRLEVLQQVLQVQAEGIAKAVDLVRRG